MLSEMVPLIETDSQVNNVNGNYIVENLILIAQPNTT